MIQIVLCFLLRGALDFVCRTWVELGWGRECEVAAPSLSKGLQAGLHAGLPDPCPGKLTSRQDTLGK